MTGQIKRTGPPTARDVKGRLVTWTVPLNAMPDKEWRQFFLQTKDTTVTCTPNHVHMYQGMMVFESLEDDAGHADAGSEHAVPTVHREALRAT